MATSSNRARRRHINTGLFSTNSLLSAKKKWVGFRALQRGDGEVEYEPLLGYIVDIDDMWCMCMLWNTTGATAYLRTDIVRLLLP